MFYNILLFNSEILIFWMQKYCDCCVIWSEMWLHRKSVRSWCDGSLDQSFIVDPLSYFSFQEVLHNWCNKGHGICYPVCGMMHIKEPLQLIRKMSPCGRSRFPLSLSEWSFTMCLMPYNYKQNVLSASLNKTFPSLLPCLCDMELNTHWHHPLTGETISLIPCGVI